MVSKWHTLKVFIWLNAHASASLKRRESERDRANHGFRMTSESTRNRPLFELFLPLYVCSHPRRLPNLKSQSPPNPFPPIPQMVKRSKIEMAGGSILTDSIAICGVSPHEPRSVGCQPDQIPRLTDCPPSPARALTSPAAIGIWKDALNMCVEYPEGRYAVG